MQKLISYAQNFEDIMLWRALSGVQDGCYIDVGAQNPDTDSVSRLFHERGWRGLHVEPAPHYANLLRERRQDEVVLQVAISDTPGVLRFFDIAETGLSTLEESIAEEHREAGFQVTEIRVPTITLDTVLEQFNGHDIHWLKIDVEGAESRVIEGWRQSELRPWVVVVESTRPLSPEQTYTEWEPAVLAKGYRFAYFDGLNRFYVSEAHLELLPAFDCGPNVFDDFSLSASSMFCGEVNLSYHALKVHTEQQIAERDALVVAQEASINHLRGELERAGVDHANAINTMELAQHRSDQEIAERDELIAAQEESINQLRRELERANADDADTINTMVRAQHRVLEETARAIEQTNGELAEAHAALWAQKVEAHRWWLRAEELASTVTTMERSRSWQLTRPLRAVRRRMSGGVLVVTKRALRPLVVASLKLAFSVPGLRRMAKPVVVRIPFLYNRLFLMASDGGMFAAAASQSKPQSPLGGCEREGRAIHLDGKARKVLEDLRIACRKGEGS